MIGSREHVKIGPYSFILDETVDAGSAVGNLYRPHYSYSLDSLFPGKQAVPGADPKDNLRPERTVWYVRDFSGGEGYRSWDENDPSVYNFSYGLNSRIPGQLTGRPSRLLDTTATVNDNSKQPHMAFAGGTLWYGGGTSIGYVNGSATAFTPLNTDAASTTTDYPDLRHNNANFAVTSMTGDGTYLYYAAWHSGGSGSRRLEAKLAKGAGFATTMAIPLKTTETGTVPYAALCVLDRTLYAWTGSRLHKYFIAKWNGSDTNIPRHMVGSNQGNDIPTTAVLGTDYYAGMVAGDTSLYCFYSSGPQSVLYEGALQTDGTMSFASVWQADSGFTIRDIAYQNGTVFMVGSYVTGHAGVWSFGINDRVPRFVGFIRKQTGNNLVLDGASASYGHQTIVSDGSTGRLFIYDADFDSFTALDSIAPDNGDGISATDGLTFVSTTSEYSIGEVITFGAYRVAMVYDKGATSTTTTYQALWYSDDEPANRQKSTATASSSNVLEMGYWDADQPFEQKALMGFEITYDPITTGQSFIVSYSVDGAAYVDLTTIDSSSPDAAKGRTYIAVTTPSTYNADGTVLANNTIKFTNFKWKITVVGARTAGPTDNFPPIIHTVAAETQTMAFAETWDLIIRLKDPQTHQRGSKSGSMQPGSVTRSFLRTLASSKQAVTFLDGYRFRQPATFSTHTVTIENIKDIVVNQGEGSMFLTLRAVPV